MENLGYTSVPSLLKYLRHAEQLGLDIDQALAAAGIKTEDLADNSKRIPSETHERLLDEPGEHIIAWHWPKLMRSLDRMDEDAARLKIFDIGCIGTLQAITYFERQVVLPWPPPASVNFNWRDGRPNLAVWFDHAIQCPSVAAHFKTTFDGDDSPDFCQAKVAGVLQAQGKNVNAGALPASDFTPPANASSDRSSQH